MDRSRSTPRSTITALCAGALSLVFVAAAGSLGATPGGDGGLAGLSAEEVQTLRELRGELEAYASNDRESSYLRRDAVAALERVHEALSDWGAPGQLEWYWDRLLEERSSTVRPELFAGAQAAARAGQYHLGGVRAFWARFDALVAERGQELALGVEAARRDFNGGVGRLEKPAAMACSVTLPRLPARDMNLSRLLKPYPEPK